MYQEKHLHHLLSRFKVEEGEVLDLRDYATSWEGTEQMQQLSAKGLKKEMKRYLKANLRNLRAAQELLWASGKRSMLIIFQAMDAAGKDSTIEHVMSGVNPQGVKVFSFGPPSSEELNHHFLWRFSHRVPERGQIGIFNRSYYEELLVVRVHPELLHQRPLPTRNYNSAFWHGRFDDIRSFEQHLCRSGTLILKFFLHVSQEEQAKRFIKRLQDPEKHWKFKPSDVEERQYWHQYQHCYAEALHYTSTELAPWYIIPADDKWKMRALVSMIITTAIGDMGLNYPEVSPEEKAALDAIRRKLEAEL